MGITPGFTTKKLIATVFVTALVQDQDQDQTGTLPEQIRFWHDGGVRTK